MKRKKTRPPQPSEVEMSEVDRLMRRMQDYKPARGEFDYAVRGQAVTDAHWLYNEAFRLRKILSVVPELAEVTREAHRLWYAAIDAAYPPGFDQDAARLHAGDAAGLEGSLAFLEADPFFYRTGYIKAKMIRHITRLPLTHLQEKRLRQVVLTVVDARDDRDFRAFCRLARRVDAPALREQLTARLASGDADIRRRARWVLEALAQKDSEQNSQKEQLK